MNSPGTILSSSPEDKSVHSREKTIGSTHVWMTAFTELISYAILNLLQNSPLLVDDSVMGLCPACSFIYSYTFKKFSPESSIMLYSNDISRQNEPECY